jgi:hypothetical protein
MMIFHLLDHDPHAIILLSRNQKQYTWQMAFQHRLIRSVDTYLDTNVITADESEQSGPVRTQLKKSMLSRIIFINQAAHSDYSRIICELDVSLDPFPFGGGVTMCDAVAGACFDRPPMLRQDRSRVARRQEYRQFESVPFATVGALQTVHKIAAGISHHINNTQLAMDVDKTKALEKLSKSIMNLMSSKTIQGGDIWRMLLESYHSDLISEFIKIATSMAKTSQENVLSALTAGELHQDSLTPESSKDPFNLIYDDHTTSQEWIKLFLRLARQLYDE